MAMLAETLQQNNLPMANTIREGFVNRTSISEDPHTAPAKRARTCPQVVLDDTLGSSHKKPWFMARGARTAHVAVASPSQSERQGGEDEGDEDISLLDPTESFSDPDLPVDPPSTLDKATANFEVEETTGPPLSEALAQWVCHIVKTPLLPDKLNHQMDRELCPTYSGEKGQCIPIPQAWWAYGTYSEQ